MSIVNGHAARLALDLDALARIFVQRLALVLERRVHGRNLLDLTVKAAAGGGDLLAGDAVGTAALQHFAFGIAGAGRMPSARRGR